MEEFILWYFLCLNYIKKIKEINIIKNKRNKDK